jgi:hypothetical protein
VRYFYTAEINAVLGRNERIGLTLLSILLATISWWFVERPFRRRGFTGTQANTLGLAAAVMAVMALAGAALVFTNGLPARFSPEALRMAAYKRYDPARAFREGSCFITPLEGVSATFDTQNCLLRSTTKPNYLIWGDSHAAHLWFGLSRVFVNANFMQATASGCTPTIASLGEPQCTKLRDFILDDFLARSHVDGVILSAFWSPTDLAGLRKTISTLRNRGLNVIVIGPAVRYRRSLPDILVSMGSPKSLPESNIASDVMKLEPIIRGVAVSAGARYVSPLEAFCQKGVCQTILDGWVPAQFDDSHLTARGSIFQAKQWKASGTLGM